MTITRFIVPLQGSSSDRYRHFHVLDKRTIKEFTIQYEAEIDGEWREIVRYDTAHGPPHKDVLHPDITESKEEFLYYTNAEVLTFGQNDIRKNWKKYREQYEKEMRKHK
ncbi:MAG: hypothetical protein Q8N45_03460 [Anaerolineales bacterium]|nr:hypothetical protein [Anaerolineales bacterium]